MRIVVDSENIRKLAQAVMIDRYGINEDMACDIAFDIEKIIKENEDD